MFLATTSTSSSKLPAPNTLSSKEGVSYRVLGVSTLSSLSIEASGRVRCDSSSLPLIVSLLALTLLALVVLACMFRERDGVFGDYKALGTGLVYPGRAKLDADFVNGGVARAGVATSVVTAPLSAL